MLRYRIAPDPRGRYVVLAAWLSLAAVNETYSTRAEAEDTANWLNRLRAKELQRRKARPRTPQSTRHKVAFEPCG